MTKSSDTTKLARQYQQIFNRVSSQLHTLRCIDLSLWFGGPVLLWRVSTTHRELLRADPAGKGSFVAHVNKWRCYGCPAWRSFMEPFFDSCGIMRDVVISIMATLAEQERIAISERTKAGLQRAKRAGRTLGRRPVEVDPAC
jgi:hypothetical protein